MQQSGAMKRGLVREPQVLELYSNFNGNVLASCFVVHPDASYLGASPDIEVLENICLKLLIY